jgi:hypothetical protein
MRHVIVVVGSEEQLEQAAPKLPKQDDESLRVTTWYASLDQSSTADLLDDRSSAIMRILTAPVLAYRFYVLVHNIRLWSSKRPLILVQDRKLASRVAAYAGTWGGGDVVSPNASATTPLGPTRFLLDENGNLKLRTD